MEVCMYAYIYVWVRLRVFVYVRLQACNVYMCVCVCVYGWLSIYIHVCIHSCLVRNDIDKAVAMFEGKPFQDY